MAAIRAAIAAGDAPALAGSAHGLLSSTGAVGAKGAFALARRLEEQGESNQRAPEIFAELEKAMDKTYASLADLTSARA